MNSQYTFTFTYNGTPTQAVETAPNSAVANTPTTPSATKGGATADLVSGAGKRVAGFVEQQALAPLNQVTGGLATPTYNVVKGIATGAGGAAIGGAVVGLAIQAIQFAISKIEERIAKNEAKAEEMNEKDNLLIKAGTRTTPTFYTGSFSGVKSTNRSGI